MVSDYRLIHTLMEATLTLSWKAAITISGLFMVIQGHKKDLFFGLLKGADLVASDPKGSRIKPNTAQGRRGRAASIWIRFV